MGGDEEWLVGCLWGYLPPGFPAQPAHDRLQKLCKHIILGGRLAWDDMAGRKEEGGGWLWLLFLPSAALFLPAKPL